MTQRTLWRAWSLQIQDEPLAKSLWEYRQRRNRIRVDNLYATPGRRAYRPNLISSITDDGKQLMILDMDFPHHIVESTTEGHSHLFIDVPMSKWRWFVLMCALRYAGVIELGFFVWSIRRGGNFVRTADTKKMSKGEFTKPTYGWFRKLKDHG